MKQKHNRVLMFEYAAGQKIEDYLYQKATVEHLFIEQIAEDMNATLKKGLPMLYKNGWVKVSKPTVSYWIRVFNIVYDPQKRSTEIPATDLKKLTVKERTVVKMRYGMGAWAPSTFKEIGAAMGISAARAQQIEKQARAKYES